MINCRVETGDDKYWLSFRIVYGMVIKFHTLIFGRAAVHAHSAIGITWHDGIHIEVFTAEIA